jgi:cold shock protein
VIAGTVKWFDAARGFGFVTIDGADADVFVSAAAVQHAGLATLRSGDRLNFLIETDRSGRRRAVELRMSAPPESRSSMTPSRVSAT